MRHTLAFVFVWAAAGAAQSQSLGPVPTRSVREGVYTVEQAERGKALYTTHCAACHQPDLHGTQPMPAPVTIDVPVIGRYLLGTSPALAGPEFVAKWNGMRLKDIYFRIRASMPQQAPGSLSRQQNADVTAYVLNANGYPAGLTELPSAEAALDGIRFDQ